MIDPFPNMSPNTWKRLASRRLLTHEVSYNGLTRSALVYFPQHLRRRGGLPLVLVLHGGASSPESIARQSAMHLLAEREGFVVAYPRGIAGKTGRTWSPAGNRTARKANDARFLRVLIDDLQRSYDIDPRRIFAAGFSIGGSLVYELADQMADRIAAVAVVSGAMTATNGAPTHPVPLIHIHGTADRRVPLKGGRGPATKRVGAWSPVQAGIDHWCAVNGCTDAAHVVRQASQGVTCHRYVGAADVELWLVEGGAHAWPGARPSPDEDSADHTGGFSATATIWSFFADHPRNRRGTVDAGDLTRTDASAC